MDKPICKVKGRIGPGAMCGSIIVGAKHCGFKGPCKHKVEFDDCAACNGAEGLPCSRCMGSGRVKRHQANGMIE
jgi:hypothetical protein